MKDIDLNIPKGAIFSEDRKYRFALWRVWSPDKPLLMTIGLNPSIAGELKDDPTITRLMSRAYKTGYGGLLMANLYAFVSTNPNALIREGSHPFDNGERVGEYTDHYIREMVKLSGIQLCGWGSFEPVAKRAPEVFAMLKAPYCLGVNADGQPKHPLYISYSRPMVPFQY